MKKKEIYERVSNSINNWLRDDVDYNIVLLGTKNKIELLVIK